MLFYVNITLIILFLSIVIRSSGAIEVKNEMFVSRISAKDIYLLICFLIFYFLSSLRSVSVGRDTYFYSRVYEVIGSKGMFAQIPKSMQGYRGYRLLCRIVYLIFEDNFYVFNFVACAITLVIIFSMIKKYSMDCYMSVLLMLLMYMLFNSWNYSRQYCAIAIGAEAVVLLREKKLITSVACVLLAISFHSTAAILMVIYLIDWIKWTRRRFVLFTIISFIGTMAFNPLVRFFLYLFPRFSYLYGKQFMSGDFGSHFGGVASGRRSLVSVLFLIIIIAVFFMAKEDCLEKLWFYMAMTMVSIVIGIVFRHYSAILRMQEYFNVITIISIPNMLETVIKNKVLCVLIKVGLICVMLVPYYVQLSENYAGIIPYKLFFE